MFLIDLGAVRAALYLGPPSFPTDLQKVADNVAVGTHPAIDRRFFGKLVQVRMLLHLFTLDDHSICQVTH